MKRRKVTRPTKTWTEIKREVGAHVEKRLSGMKVSRRDYMPTAEEIRAAARAQVKTPWGDKSSLFAEALAQMSPGDRLQAWNDLVIYGTAMIWRPAKGKPVLVPPMELLIAQAHPTPSLQEIIAAKPKRGRK